MWCINVSRSSSSCAESIDWTWFCHFLQIVHVYQHVTDAERSSFSSTVRLLQDMLLKRAADIAEALYSVPRPHSQLQALPSSPAHGSVMGLGSYPSQLGVSIGEPGQSSQGERNNIVPEEHPFPSRGLGLMQFFFFNIVPNRLH